MTLLIALLLGCAATFTAGLLMLLEGTAKQREYEQRLATIRAELATRLTPRAYPALPSAPPAPALVAGSDLPPSWRALPPGPFLAIAAVAAAPAGIGRPPDDHDGTGTPGWAGGSGELELSVDREEERRFAAAFARFAAACGRATQPAQRYRARHAMPLWTEVRLGSARLRDWLLARRRRIWPASVPAEPPRRSPTTPDPVAARATRYAAAATRMPAYARDWTTKGHTSGLNEPRLPPLDRCRLNERWRDTPPPTARRFFADAPAPGPAGVGRSTAAASRSGKAEQLI